MTQLKPGNKTPAFALPDQEANLVRSSDYGGKKLFVYFYPKADTPGCTLQAQAIRDALPQLKKLGVAMLGISPDAPQSQKKFDVKYSLGFPLLSDPDHHVASAFGVWGEKKMFGKVIEGVVRSAFLIDEAGLVQQAWYRISPKDTVPTLKTWLAA